MNLNREKLISIAKGAAIAAAGAVLTYVTQAIASVDFGPSTAIVVAGWSIVVNVARKFLVSE